MTFSYTMALHAGVSPMRNCDIHEGNEPCTNRSLRPRTYGATSGRARYFPVHPSCGGS
jgi:hypothetical protein